MQGFDGAAYDRWLEAPYVEAAQREAAFETFCERFGLDPEADASWAEFEDYDPYDEYDGPEDDGYDYAQEADDAADREARW